VIKKYVGEMESIKEMYKIGNGPSSSHTMGPKRAAEQFLSKNSSAEKFEVTLFGSLAATGKGHLTDKVLYDTFGKDNLEIIWKPEEFLPKHSNAMRFKAYSDSEVIDQWTAYSIGGGAVIDDNTDVKSESIYPESTMDEILIILENEGQQFWEYVEQHECDIWDYLSEVWQVMKNSIQRGLEKEGTLPGVIKLPRKAHQYYTKSLSLKHSLKTRSLVFSYALAVSEENASGGEVVTAPTCGSSGVLPAVLYHIQKSFDFPDSKILKALATAGLIGNLVKTNASISGAEVGCQGEVGTASAMASAAVLQLFGGSANQIEYAAEMGLEHHLGLTCDPIAGLVQVPCIERNAFAATRALDANTYAMLSDGKHRVSFDKVVRTMKQTGFDLPVLYKETSAGGLATQC